LKDFHDWVVSKFMSDTKKMKNAAARNDLIKNGPTKAAAVKAASMPTAAVKTAPVLAASVKPAPATVASVKSAPVQAAPAKPAPVIPVKPAAPRPATVAAAAVPTPARNVVPAKPETPKAGRISLELVKPEAKKVCVAGSFNEWKPEKTPLVQMGNGRWVGDLTVNPGKYEYLFVVDGQWLPDPNAKESVQNPFGGKNSILTVSA